MAQTVREEREQAIKEWLEPENEELWTLIKLAMREDFAVLARTIYKEWIENATD